MATALEAVVGMARARKGKHRPGYRRPPVQIDLGTLELQAKRRAIVGRTVQRDAQGNAVIVPGNPHKSTCPLDALLERGCIDAAQYAAGRRYSWLYARALGRQLDPIEVSISGLYAMCGEAEDCPSCKDCTPRKIANAWRAAYSAIPDRRAKDAVDNCTVYHRWPRWFVALIGGLLVHRPSDYTDRAALIRGLNALVAAGCVMRDRG